jgi:hypothetical protein
MLLLKPAVSEAPLIRLLSKRVQDEMAITGEPRIPSSASPSSGGRRRWAGLGNVPIYGRFETPKRTVVAKLHTREPKEGLVR